MQLITLMFSYQNDGVKKMIIKDQFKGKVSDKAYIAMLEAENEYLNTILDLQGKSTGVLLIAGASCAAAIYASTVKTIISSDKKGK